MAYSKELETVIDAALADGVITEKERAVLHKKALLEGVDPDELDVVIEGRLAKMKREVDWLRPTPPKNLENEKRGNVVKCPNCGAPVVSGSAVCSECGYTFSNVKVNSSIEKLAEKIDAIEKSLGNESLKGQLFGGLSQNGSRKAQAIASAIKNFPVPNTREDLLEFLSAMSAKGSKFGDMGDSADQVVVKKAYYAKFVECTKKAKANFASDSAFLPYFEEYNKKLWQVHPALMVVGGSILFLILLAKCIY